MGVQQVALTPPVFPALGQAVAEVDVRDRTDGTGEALNRT